MMHNLQLNFKKEPSLLDWLNILARFKVASLTQLQSIFPIEKLDLSHFEKEGTLLRFDIPTLTGDMKTILVLGRKGAEEVAKETGKAMSAIPYFTPARFKRSMFTIEHELGITDVGLCLYALSKRKDQFKLIHWETSPQRIGTSVQVASKKGIDCIPLVADAFFGIGFKKNTHWILLELDRGTIDLKRMRRKFIGYREWWKAQGPKHRFGIKNLRILYIVPNQKRLKALLALWQEVSEHGGRGFIWFALQNVTDISKPEKLLQSEFHRVGFTEPQFLFNQ